MSSVDPTRCPICHEPNVCGMEKAKATGIKAERCWCMDAVFSPSVMDQVPEAPLPLELLYISGRFKFLSFLFAL